MSHTAISPSTHSFCVSSHELPCTLAHASLPLVPEPAQTPSLPTGSALEVGEGTCVVTHDRDTEDMLTVALNAVFRCLSNVHAEHDDLGCHGGHLIAEAILEFSIHVSCKRVLAIGLSVTTVYNTSIWPNDLCG